MILGIGTFNVLAMDHLDKGEYDPAAIALLRGKWRIPLLLKLINSLEADVLGLQEVELSLVTALEATEKWHVRWAPKTMGARDGCALLVRLGIDVRGYSSHSYSDGSGHVWQQVKIGDVTVVNTHIKWAPEENPNHAGVIQTRKLLRHLGKQAIILGDCNGRPGGRVRALVDEAGFQNVWGDEPTARVVKNGHAEHAAIDLVAYRGSIHGETVGTLRNVATIPNVSCPSDHIPVMTRFTFM